MTKIIVGVLFTVVSLIAASLLHAPPRLALKIRGYVTGLLMYSAFVIPMLLIYEEKPVWLFLLFGLVWIPVGFVVSLILDAMYSNFKKYFSKNKGGK